MHRGHLVFSQILIRKELFAQTFCGVLAEQIKIKKIKRFKSALSIIKETIPFDFKEGWLRETP